MTTSVKWVASEDLPPADLEHVADACDHCPEYRPNSEVVLPWAIRVDGDNLTALYRCPSCRHTWYTSWNAEYVGLTNIPVSDTGVTAVADRWLANHGSREPNGGDAA